MLNAPSRCRPIFAMAAVLALLAAGCGGGATKEAKEKIGADTGAVTDDTKPDSRQATADRKGSANRRSGGATVGTGGTTSGGAGSVTGGSKRTQQLPSRPGATRIGVTKTSIKIGWVAGWSGQFGAILDRIYQNGWLTWQDDVNRRGGIFGRKINTVKVDHRETADGGVAACKESTGNGTFLAWIGEGREAAHTSSDCLNKARMLNFVWAAPRHYKWAYSYSLFANYEDQADAMPSFITNVLKASKKRMGLIYVNNPLEESGAREFKIVAKTAKFNLVRTEVVEVNQSSFVPQMVRMQDDNVEVVIVVAGLEAAGMWRDARAINYRPQFTGFGHHFDFVTQAARQTADGVKGLRQYLSVDTKAYQEFLAKARDYGRDTGADAETAIFYGEGLLLEKILRAAGPDLTREKFILATQKLKNYFNGYMPPLTWGPGDTLGTAWTWPAVCCTPEYNWKTLGPPRLRY